VYDHWQYRNDFTRVYGTEAGVPDDQAEHVPLCIVVGVIAATDKNRICGKALERELVSVGLANAQNRKQCIGSDLDQPNAAFGVLSCYRENGFLWDFFFGHGFLAPSIVLVLSLGSQPFFVQILGHLNVGVHGLPAQRLCLDADSFVNHCDAQWQLA
jgi:hypothetical protein